MRNLVESVIDGVLQRQQMQQHAATQKQRHAAINAPSTRQTDPAHTHRHGSRLAASSEERDPALWKVSTQFEAVFVQQMMTEMRKTVHKSDVIPNGFAEDVHGSMMDAAIAQASVKHQRFGIAENIYRQLEAGKNAAMRPGAQQPGAIQAISDSADTLQMKHDITLEAIKHAD